ncbi:MAG: hypothetical protein ACJAXA_002063 [Candidatus Aldehydirespiratoraceae bacterium]|jgi:hypothetical protein
MNHRLWSLALGVAVGVPSCNEGGGDTTNVGAVVSEIAGPVARRFMDESFVLQIR